MKLRRMRWAGMWHASDSSGKHKVLVAKPKGKRQLGRLKRRWEDGIRMDLREIDWGGVDSPGSG
jgi:hypothetical protein